MAAAAAFSGTLENGFIALDDGVYIAENSLVLSGLSASGVRSAFSMRGEDHPGSYFHPLTWLSLMLDAELFGPGPRGFHLTNLVLHALTAALLLVLLERATQGLWPSAFVALLFALHPTQVEAVAWAAERKTVLSGLLGVVALGLYGLYAQRPSLVRYLGAAAFFLASLLAKPMLVAFPALALLLDYWPLGRLRFGPTSPLGCPKIKLLRAAAEKVPLLALGIGVTALSIFSFEGQPTPGRLPPLSLRLAQAPLGYLEALTKIAAPLELGVLYPYPTEVNLLASSGAAALLLAITAGALFLRTRAPALGVGWLWFVISLGPAIGLVQPASWPRWADRFAYLPLLGLGVAAAACLSELAARWRWVGKLAWAVAPLLLVLASLLTVRQVERWRDTVTLFQHTLQIEPSKPSHLQYDLGVELARTGRYAEAEEVLLLARRAAPRRSMIHNALGNVYALTGRPEQALVSYEEAVQLDPENVEAAFNFASLLDARGRTEEATAFWCRVLRSTWPPLASARETARARVGAACERPSQPEAPAEPR